MISSILRLALVASVLATITSAAELPKPKGLRAVFEISDTIVQASPARFGANIEPPPMTHWNTEPWHNQWWLGPNPNPITARVKGTATGGSATTLENEGTKFRPVTLGYNDTFRDGFFDGGTAVVYRLVEGKVVMVRESKIARFQAGKEGPNLLTFDEPGPAVQAGDEYVLTVVRTEFPESITRTWAAKPWWLYFGLSLTNGQEQKLWDAGIRTRLAPDAPPGGGGASFALDIPPGYTGPKPTVGYWLCGGLKADQPKLRAGQPYSLRLWLKQTGMATGTVDVDIATLASKSLQVTQEWHEYEIDFVGAAPRGVGALTIGTSEPGTLLIDNITLVDKSGPPPYGFYPEIVETLQRFHPSSLRLWALQDNTGFGLALDDALGDPATSNLTWQTTHGAKTTVPVGLHRQLELCAQVGTEPWIIVSTMFSPREQKNLIEYLAGPATSPYGKKRAELGRSAPWTETFKQIKLEIGNETWNRRFAPQNFPNRGEFYGAYAEFMFQQMKASPWFRPEKFQLVINGWVAQPKDDGRGFSSLALRNAPSAQAIDIAYYTSGWDAVGLMQANNPAESWMNILTYSRRMLSSRAKEFKTMTEKIAADQGRAGAVKSLVYEAGPGYTLPGPGKFNLDEQQQGKSLAHAINALDIFMSNLREGYGDQSFFMFKNGHYWSSHNRTWGEHIVWKALGMRNALLKGDLITATAKQMVTLDLPKTQADVISQRNSADKKVKTFPAVPNLPLIDCYPFRQGKRYATMLISRRLDGPTEVLLNLPHAPKSDYSIYSLSGATPDLHNIDSEVVKVVREDLKGMTQQVKLIIPQHSILVLVNDVQ